MTTWWNKNIPGQRLEEFKSWLVDGHQTDRLYCRKYIAREEYKTFLDCGCGIAVEYFGFKDDPYEIDYTGLDSCNYLIDLNRSRDIQMIDAELDNPLPLQDDSYDCVYAREIIEHLQFHRRTLDELIRVAKKEVIITWFIRPDHEPEDIRYRQDEDLYHNKYNVDKLEKFILSNDKVESLSWHEPNEKHTVLHIKMKPYQPRLCIEERDRLAEEERLSTLTDREQRIWNEATEEEIIAERTRWFALPKEEREKIIKQAKERKVVEEERQAKRKQIEKAQEAKRQIEERQIEERQAREAKQAEEKKQAAEEATEPVEKNKDSE